MICVMCHDVSLIPILRGGLINILIRWGVYIGSADTNRHSDTDLEIRCSVGVSYPPTTEQVITDLP